MEGERQSVRGNRGEAQRHEQRPAVHAIGEEAAEDRPECLRRQVDAHRVRAPGLGASRLRHYDRREGQVHALDEGRHRADGEHHGEGSDDMREQLAQRPAVEPTRSGRGRTRQRKERDGRQEQRGKHRHPHPLEPPVSHQPDDRDRSDGIARRSREPERRHPCPAARAGFHPGSQRRPGRVEGRVPQAREDQEGQEHGIGGSEPDQREEDSRQQRPAYDEGSSAAAVRQPSEDRLQHRSGQREGHRDRGGQGDREPQLVHDSRQQRRHEPGVGVDQRVRQTDHDGRPDHIHPGRTAPGDGWPGGVLSGTRAQGEGLLRPCFISH